MASLYTKDDILCKLWDQFSQFFSEQTKPTAQHPFELVLSVFALNGFHRVGKLKPCFKILSCFLCQFEIFSLNFTLSLDFL